MKKTYILSLVFSAIAFFVYGQSEFIDRSFGDEGTVSFQNDSLESYTVLGVDSLDNIYISHTKVDSAYNRYLTLVKLNSQGEIIDEEFEFDLKENRVYWQFIRNKLLLTELIDESSFVYIYDLDYNREGRYIIPFTSFFQTISPHPDGGLEGLVNNIFFRFNPDGSLDKSFGNNGLVDFEQIKNQDTHADFWIRTKDNTIYLLGGVLDTSYNVFRPASIQLESNGQIKEINNDSLAIHLYEKKDLSAFFCIPEQAIDENYLLNCYVIDTQENSFNIYSLLTKVNEDGELIRGFGNNGVLNINKNQSDILTHNDGYKYTAQFANGSLLFQTIIENEQDSIVSEYLSLYNENGIQEKDFGFNSTIDLRSYKRQVSSSSIVLNNELYIIKHDTIQYFLRPSSAIKGKRNIATHITRFNTVELLDYQPIAPPQESKFVLFPNPITSESNIKYDGPHLENIDLVIYNMVGQMVDKISIPTLFNYGEISISLSGNSPGVYHLLINQNGQQIWQTQLMKVESK